MSFNLNKENQQIQSCATLTFSPLRDIKALLHDSRIKISDKFHYQYQKDPLEKQSRNRCSSQFTSKPSYTINDQIRRCNGGFLAEKWYWTRGYVLTTTRSMLPFFSLTCMCLTGTYITYDRFGIGLLVIYHGVVAPSIISPRFSDGTY